MNRQSGFIRDRSLFHFFFLIFWRTTNDILNVLSCRICTKHFLFVFYYPTTFTFVEFLVIYFIIGTESSSSFSCTTTIAVSATSTPLSFPSRTDMMVYYDEFILQLQEGFTSTPTIWRILSSKDLITQRSSGSILMIHLIL